MEEKKQSLTENQQEVVNISILLPIELHRKLKHWCFDNDKKIKDFICECIKSLPEQR